MASMVDDDGDALRRSAEVARHRKTAILRFNSKPKLGLEFLRGMGLWDGSPGDLAAWIDGALGGGLSKRRVGEFFGGIHPLARPTFDAFLGESRAGDLGPGKPLDAALRVLLRRFRLPGEAQCIDRVVERFARAFKAANPPGSPTPWPFSEDAAYVLSFSLVMLNTDLHSQNIKDADRMTRSGFVANNRGIDAGGGDLPPDLLGDLYDGVRREEIKMDEGDLYESELITYMGARKAGWLEKRNAKGPLRSAMPSWRRLWFVLNDGCLYYFLSPGDADVAAKPPRAIVPLDQGLEVRRPLGAAPGREFTLVARGDAAKDGNAADAADAPPRAIKSMKHTAAGPAKGTAAEIVLRARTVGDAAAWADALRAEEEALPAGGAALGAAKAAAAARARRLSRVDDDDGGGAGAAAGDKWKLAQQENSHTPLLAGWLRKRGEINTAWRKRYFALFSGVTCTDVEGETPPADEPVLMYFKDEDKFRSLASGAGRPYKGAVRLGAVKEMKRRRAESGAEGARAAGLALVTEDRTWLLAPVDGGSPGDLDAWWYALEGACHAAQLGASRRRPSSRAAPPPAIGAAAPEGSA